MRTTNFFIFLLMVFSCMTSAARKKESTLKVVQLEPRIYVSAVEISNAEYRLFLNDLLTMGQTEKYSLCVYDSLKWQSIATYNAPLTEYYHRHAAYNAYPVVNLSKYAMEAYCNWLTENYASSHSLKFKKVIFRLPTEAEYRKMYAYNTNMSATTKKKKSKREYSATSYDHQLPTPVYAFSPNKLGIYNLTKNVSEVTAEGKILGGNFSETNEEVSSVEKQTYFLPDARVGFRYIMEVVNF